MKVIRGKIEGDTELTEHTNLKGMIVGTVTLLANTILKLDGMIVGDLIVEDNCSVDLYGMVNGDVVNKGGRLAVFGMVMERLSGRLVRLSSIRRRLSETGCRSLQ